MTQMLVTRAELDLISWCATRLLSKRAISDGPRATITVQFGKKLHTFCRKVALILLYDAL